MAKRFVTALEQNSGGSLSVERYVTARGAELKMRNKLESAARHPTRLSTSNGVAKSRDGLVKVNPEWRPRADSTLPEHILPRKHAETTSPANITIIAGASPKAEPS